MSRGACLAVSSRPLGQQQRRPDGRTCSCCSGERQLDEISIKKRDITTTTDHNDNRTANIYVKKKLTKIYVTVIMATVHIINTKKREFMILHQQHWRATACLIRII